MSARISRLPTIQQDLELSAATLGAALSAIWVGALAAMPVTGWLVHRIGGRASVMVALVTQCLALPPIGLARDAVELIAAFLFFGIASGAMGVSMNAEGVAVEQGCGSPIMASLHGLFSLGAMAGAALGGVAAGRGILPALHFAGAAAVLGVAGLLAARGLPSKADRAASRHSGFVFHPRIAALGLLAFCILVGEGAMADWTAIYLRSVVGTSVAESTAGYAVFSALMATGRLTGDPLCVRLGPVRMVRVGALLAAAGFALAIAAATEWAALAGFALVGAGYATIIPNTYSAAGRVAGVPRGNAIAAVTLIGYSGFLTGPPVIGWTADQAGLRMGLIIVPALAVIAAGLSRSLDPRHNM